MTAAPQSLSTPPHTTRVFLPAVTTLAWREVTRFFRQRNRVIGAIVTPILFWLLLGFGVGDALRISPDTAALPITNPLANELTAAGNRVGYLEFFFPGAVLMMVLFTAIFSTITVIEDRREGFLQSVLASPASRTAVVLGKVLGGALIATLQGLVMLIMGALMFGQPSLLSFLPAVGLMFLIAVGLTALGLSLAWPMNSTAGFHAIMNVLLLPMWFLSGAVFPLATAAGPMRWAMLLNPLTHGQAVFAAVLQGSRAADPGVSLVIAAAITVLATTTAVAFAVRQAHRG